MTPGALCLALISLNRPPGRGIVVNHCSAGCPTPGAHESWGACVRSKRLQIPDITAHDTNNAIYEASDAYRAAREDGLQPETVSMAAVQRARRVTDATGIPFRADKDNYGMPFGGQE